MDASAFYAGRAERLTEAARTTIRSGYAGSLTVLLCLCLAAVAASFALARRGPFHGTSHTETLH